jgi:hypothetical protein
LRIAALLAVVAALLLGQAPGATAAEAVVRPAVDAIFAAFRQHPIVGLGDAHGLAEEGEFYGRLIRDPRFAAEVGNVVVETAGAAHQATLDRYLNGEDVPRAELRRVWTDVVGAVPTVTSEMYPQFLAEVRAVNLKLPPSRRIRVWAGEPPIDWTTIRSREGLEPFMLLRDEHPAATIQREILGRGKKALVIYGGLHFFPLPAPPGLPPNPSLRELIERRRPGAVFVIQPYFGFWQPECTAAFEAETRWPPGSLVTPLRGTPVADLLLRPGCTMTPPPRALPGAPAIPPDVQAGFLRIQSGAEADALLYLGPAASLTRSPDIPDLLADTAYAAEITRRLPIIGAPPDALTRLTLTRRPYRTVAKPPAPPSPPPVAPAP